MPASPPLIAVSSAPPRSQSSCGDSVVFATVPRAGSSALAQSAVQLAQQGMQLRLLLRAEYGEAVGDKRLVRRHHLAKERVTGVGEIQPIGPPGLAPLDEPRMLQLIQQLADVALGHQQPVCQRLLRHALGRADMADHVELGNADVPRAQLLLRGVFHALEDADQPQPSGNGPAFHRDASPSLMRLMIRKTHTSPATAACSIRCGHSTFWRFSLALNKMACQACWVRWRRWPRRAGEATAHPPRLQPPTPPEISMVPAVAMR